MAIDVVEQITCCHVAACVRATWRTRACVYTRIISWFNID